MEIALHGVGKRFGRDWILRDVDLAIQSGEHVAILGGNGSGKSTLLRIISGQLSPNKGTLSYKHEQQEIEVTEIYRHLSYAAPYHSLYTDMSLKEAIRFHFSLRKYRSDSGPERLLEELNLPVERRLDAYSSGMRQRVSLALAMHTESALLLLDEPTMNLDEENVNWYSRQLAAINPSTTVLIASNVQGLETQSCARMIEIGALSNKA